MNYGRVISSGGRILRRLCTNATVAKNPAKTPSLYQRLLGLEKTGKSVSETLNQYILEGKGIGKMELDGCVQELRKYRRFHHAFEIIEWMKMRNIQFNYAVHLDLVSKVKRLDVAENYFTNLPPHAKNNSTYGCLLNCYCMELMVDKALAHFDQMDKLGYVNGLAFTNLMSMYMRLGNPQKVHQLVNDMKQRKIPMTAFTYIVWMNSYASLNDLAGVDRVFNEMKEKAEDQIGWKTYSNLAAIYVKAEQSETAEQMLKKLEEVMKPRQREPYHSLLSLYGGTGNLKEVYRVWGALKSISPVTNESYILMLSTLQRLNDTEGVIKCIKEWESRCINYDARLITIAVNAYLSQNMDEEAASIFNKAMGRCRGHFFRAREMFMMFYLEKGRLDDALSHLKAAVDNKWHRSPKVVSAFLKYYEDKTDLDGVHELCKILKTGNLDKSSLESCVASVESSTESHPILKEVSDDNNADEKLHG